MQDPRYRIINPKFQAPNPKWFGQLTILSQVEGQISKFQGSKHSLIGYCTPRALPQNDCVILQGASAPEGAWQSLFLML